jgi:curved DNA-binding protein
MKDGYRKLAFEYHPDRNKGNPKASERMKAVDEAYAVLSNPSKVGISYL